MRHFATLIFAQFAASEIGKKTKRSLHGEFFDIAELNYNEAQILLGQLTLVERLADVAHENTKQFVETEIKKIRTLINKANVTVVFSTMAAEALINFYLAEHSSNGMLDKHLDSLKLESKWFIGPKFVRNITIAPDSSEIQNLRILIKNRNALVHSRAKIVKESEAEAIIYEPLAQAEHALKTYIRLQELLHKLDPSEE